MENFDQQEKDEIFSKRVPAGKRTYFFDVKATRGNELYMTITESKKRFRDDGTYFYDKHKIFLYQEDFEKFLAGINDAMEFIGANKGNVEVSSNAYAQPVEAVAESRVSDINFDDLGN